VIVGPDNANDRRMRRARAALDDRIAHVAASTCC
jgi:hypothetical protein